MGTDLLCEAPSDSVQVWTFLRSLEAAGRIRFDAPARRWDWDLPAIQASGITDNVVEMMAGKIHGLAEDTRRVQDTAEQLLVAIIVVEIGCIELHRVLQEPGFITDLVGEHRLLCRGRELDRTRSG